MMNIQTFYGKDWQFDLASNILKLVLLFTKNIHKHKLKKLKD